MPHATAARASAEPPVFAQLRDAWPTLLERMRDLGGTHAWSVAQSVHPRDLAGDLLVFEVPSRTVLDQFRGERGATDSPSAVLRTAINEMFGITVKFQPQRPAGASASGTPSGTQAPSRADEPAPAPAEPDPAPARAASPAARERSAPTSSAPAAQSKPAAAPSSAPASSSGLNWTVAKIPGQESIPDDGPGSGWATAAIPGTATAPGAGSASQPTPSATPNAAATATAPRNATAAAQSTPTDEAPAPEAQPAPPAPKRTQRVASAPVIPGVERYGEAIVRERLGARFIGEDIIAPEPEAVELPPEDDFSAPPPPEDGGY